MEELESTINRISKIMEEFDSLSFFDVYYNKTIPIREVRTMNERLQRAYDELFRLRKHLNYLKKKKGEIEIEQQES